MSPSREPRHQFLFYSYTYTSRFTLYGRVFTLCPMLFALCFWEMAKDRLEKCVRSPMGKGRAIQGLGGGDISAPSEWSSLPGQALAGGKDSGTVEG